MASEFLDALGTSANRRVYLIVLLVILGFVGWTWWERRSVDVPLVVEVRVFSDEARTRPRDNFDVLIDGTVVETTSAGVGVRVHEMTAARGRDIGVGVVSTDDRAISDGPRFRLVTPDLLGRDPEGRLLLREEFVLQTTRHRELFVRVVDEDGIPLAGVSVSADGRVVGETSGDGTASFSVPEDAPVRVEPRLAGATFDPESRLVEPGSAVALGFQRVAEPVASADLAGARETEPPRTRDPVVTPPRREDPPPRREDPPVVREDAPVVRDDPPVVRDDPPVVRQDPPAARDDLPVVREDPAAARDASSTPADAGDVRSELPDVRTDTPDVRDLPDTRDVVPVDPTSPADVDPVRDIGTPGGLASTTILFVSTLPGTLMVNDGAVGSAGPGPWTYRADVGQSISAVLKPFARDGLGCRPQRVSTFSARAGNPDVRFADFDCGAPVRGALDFERDYVRATAHLRATPADAYRIQVDPPRSAADHESYGRLLWMRARGRENRGRVADALEDYRRSFEYRASATTAVDLLACAYQNAPCGDPDLLARTVELASRQSVSRETREKLRAYGVFIWNCRLQDASDRDARNLYRSRLCDAITEYYDGLSRGGPRRHAQDVRTIDERVGCRSD